MIEKYNFHWKEGFFYNFPKKREIFNLLINEIETKQIISISGLRRTGKTVLLKQIIDYLISSKGVSRLNILFFSFDEEYLGIDEIIKEYEAKTGKDILKNSERIYIFLDEVQNLYNWQNQIKYYYDNFPNIKFFISGSSSLFIKKQTRESLAGRIYEFVLEPLSFKEFLIFRNKEELIKKAGLFEDEIRKEFLSYQKRQMIEIVNEDEDRAGLYVKTIIEKIIYQDIPKIFRIENEDLLMRIMRIIASNPGMLVDYDALSNELGISRVTLSNYFFYLEEAFLITKLYNFSRNMLTSEKKMKKVYFSSTSFFTFLNNQVDESRLIENLIVVFEHAKFFWRTPQSYEVDIVLERDGRIFPVEVKYKDNILPKELKNIFRFAKRFDIEKAMVVTKNLSDEKEIIIGDRKIVIEFVPSWKICLT